jgi:hypothetical protein
MNVTLVVARHNGPMMTCPECGFTYEALSRVDVNAGLREGAAALAQKLRSGSPTLRTRPSPGVWSALEYGCHVRDVSLMQRDRLYVALVEDEPSFKPMYREQRVAFDRYDDQAPEAVAEQLVMGVELFAHALEGLAEDQWPRPLLYGFPGPMRVTVEWMSHHTLHEVVHHRADVERLIGV